MRRRTGVVVHAGPVVSAAATGPGRALDVDGRPHVLTPLGDAVHGELSWLQPAVFRRQWQLVSERGEHLLIRGRGLTGRHCTVETPAATWALARGWTLRELTRNRHTLEDIYLQVTKPEEEQ